MRHLTRRRHPRWRSFANWASALLVAVVCLLALFTVVVPFAMGATPYTVLTGSMRPTLEPGSLVGVRPVDIADVRPGDIVTFQLRSGEPEVATHRVVGVAEDGRGARELTTRGDANNVADAAPVRAEQVRGVVVYAVPWLGYVNAWANPVVRSAVVTALGIGAIGYGVVLLVGDGVRRRRSARVGAASLVVVAAVACATCLPARASAVAPPDDALQVSVDGSTWHTGGDLTMFAGEYFVPGDDVSETLWLRNRSRDRAVPSLELAWQPADPAAPADISLARSLGVEVEGVEVEGVAAHDTAWTGPPIPPGATRAVRISAIVPWETDGSARNGRATLTIVVRLTEAAAISPPHPEHPEDLAVTGGTFWPWAAPVAIAGVGAGAALYATARRRRRVTGR
jgi:signal peptidase I